MLLALATLLATTACRATDQVPAGENTEPPVQQRAAGRKCVRKVKMGRPAQRGVMAAASSSQPAPEVDSYARTNEEPSTMLTPAAQRRSLERLLELQIAFYAAERADPGGPTGRQLQGRIKDQLGVALGVLRELGERLEEVPQAAPASELVPDLVVLNALSGEELTTLPRTTAPMSLLEIERAVGSALNLSPTHQRLVFLGPDGVAMDPWVEHDVESVTAVVLQIPPQVEVFRTAKASVNLPDALWVLPTPGTSEDVLGTCHPYTGDLLCRGRAVGADPAVGSEAQCVAVMVTDQDLQGPASLHTDTRGFPHSMARRVHRCVLMGRWKLLSVAPGDFREALQGVAGGEVSEDIVSLYTTELATLGFI